MDVNADFDLGTKPLTLFREYAYQRSVSKSKGKFEVLPSTEKAPISLEPAVAANSLCPPREKRTMREIEVRIGNPSLI